MLIGPTNDINLILNLDSHLEPEQCHPMLIQSSMGTLLPRLDPDPYAYGYGESMEGSLDPLEFQLENPEMNWAQELRESSVPDTSAGAGILSPPTPATEERASYSMVVRREAEFLGLELPLVAVRSNHLTEVLQPGASSSEPLLPFNETLSDVMLRTWPKPITEAPVKRTIASTIGLHLMTLNS
ncbi:hypothetical protein NDU88_002910 [Pleurodeles waltl]|uniref:Uncharacterized protein n=1 Tax=Pleurodeles waltl TaxID=8319 RepID=A0AAV7NF60_PLEWA|nr:hypothetical protein NDU88_002910 [Pleurodeles waltl]